MHLPTTVKACVSVGLDSMWVRTVIEIAHVQGGAIEMLAVIFSSPPLTEGTYLHSLTHTTDAGANVAPSPPPFILPSPSSPTNRTPPRERPNLSSLLGVTNRPTTTPGVPRRLLIHGSPRRDEGDRKATALDSGSRGGEGEANGKCCTGGGG